MNGATSGLSGGQDAAPGANVLTFSVAGQVYGIGISDVREIIEYGAVTRVPMVGRQIRGVLNLRGRIVPVIDLAERLELPGGAEAGRRACVVVVNARAGDEVMELGLAVDGVNKVLPLDAGQMRAAPSFGTAIRDDFIVSMARVEEGYVVILDQARVLCIDELAETAA
jgi:purine-binding chemotaxis protein CheW